MKAAILTFHATPNYGATLQCVALSNFLRRCGADVDVINYVQPHNLLQYFKSSFLGRRRSWQNVKRMARFREFVRHHVTMSGAPIMRPSGLRQLASRYNVAFTGSDEVWKVDHMRKLDPSYYLDFCDARTTRICSYAASASTVTDLRQYADTVGPLLQRFDGLAIRDPYTLNMVRDLTGRADAVQVVDPTLLTDWADHDLPPILREPYLAVYAWLNSKGQAAARSFADRHGLKIVSIGCRNAIADHNLIGIGPQEWLQLIKHARVVMTDFFHGLVFALIFQRPFYAHVDPAKRLKLEHILKIAGLDGRLHHTADGIANLSVDELDADWLAVKSSLLPQQEASRQWLRAQLALASAKG